MLFVGVKCVSFILCCSYLQNLWSTTYGLNSLMHFDKYAPILSLSVGYGI